MRRVAKRLDDKIRMDLCEWLMNRAVLAQAGPHQPCGSIEIDSDEHRLWEFGRQMLNEGADRRQQALPVRDEGRQRRITGDPFR